MYGFHRFDSCQMHILFTTCIIWNKSIKKFVDLIRMGEPYSKCIFVCTAGLVEGSIVLPEEEGVMK